MSNVDNVGSSLNSQTTQILSQQNTPSKTKLTTNDEVDSAVNQIAADIGFIDEVNTAKNTSLTTNGKDDSDGSKLRQAKVNYAVAKLAAATDALVAKGMITSDQATLVKQKLVQKTGSTLDLNRSDYLQTASHDKAYYGTPWEDHPSFIGGWGGRPHEKFDPVAAQYVDSANKTIAAETNTFEYNAGTSNTGVQQASNVNATANAPSSAMTTAINNAQTISVANAMRQQGRKAGIDQTTINTQVSKFLTDRKYTGTGTVSGDIGVIAKLNGGMSATDTQTLTNNFNNLATAQAQAAADSVDASGTGKVSWFEAFALAMGQILDRDAAKILAKVNELNAASGASGGTDLGTNMLKGAVGAIPVVGGFLSGLFGGGGSSDNSGKINTLNAELTALTQEYNQHVNSITSAQQAMGQANNKLSSRNAA